MNHYFKFGLTFCFLLSHLQAQDKTFLFKTNTDYVQSVKNKSKKPNLSQEEEMKELQETIDFLESILEQLEQDIDQIEKYQELKKSKEKRNEPEKNSN